MPDTRPNVLWIVFEDTSPRFGCYGDSVAHTPAIDSLAEDGVRFPDAFCTSPVCSPSRSAIHTGCYQTSIGTHHHRTSRAIGSRPAYEAVPPYYVRLVSEYLREAGYYCVWGGDTDFAHATPISAFDECSSTNSWDDDPDWVVEETHWSNAPDDQPFFAVVNPSMTHESGMFVDPDDDPETDPAAVEVPPYFPDTEIVRRTIAHHYDNIARADEVVAETLAELEEAGVADETAVFLFSDHGEGMPRGKRWLYDSGLRVPMIVRWPGRIEGGETRDRLVSNVDVAPTVLSLAGVDRPTHMDGRPFVGPGAEDRAYVFGARDRHDEFHDTVRAVRDERYKYVRNYQPGRPFVLQNRYRNQHPIMQEILRLRAEDDLTGAAADWATGRRPPEELYDLRDDPYEVHNLIDEPGYDEQRRRLRGALDDWLERTGDRGLDAEDRMLADMWPGDGQPTTATPTFVPNSVGNRGTEPLESGTQLQAPAELDFYCATQGASIVYRTDGDDRWRLHTGPIRLPEGETTVRTRAIRYGYEESEQREATFTVEAA